MPTADLGAKRIDAFLLLLRTIENKGITGDRAYYRAFGKNHYFMKTSDHPRQFYTGWNGKRSTAAGAYGITEETYDWVKPKAHVIDFSPASQDQIARWLIYHYGAGSYIEQDEYHPAYAKLKARWSSLPHGISQEITEDDADKFIDNQVKQ